MDLLHAQFNSGHLSLEEIKTVLGVDFSNWNTLRKKFKSDESGLFFNERLDNEMIKRREFSRKQSENALRRFGNAKLPARSDTKTVPLENGNEDVNENVFDSGKAFEVIWEKYPDKSGKKEAVRHFLASVETQEDFASIEIALENYLKSQRVKNGYIQNGSTWFNNWKDWISPTETTMQKGLINGNSQHSNRQTSATERAGFHHTESDVDRIKDLTATLQQHDRERGERS